MSTLVGSSLFATVNTKYPNKTYKTMATCVDNSRTSQPTPSHHLSVSDQPQFYNPVSKLLKFYRPCLTDFVSQTATNLNLEQLPQPRRTFIEDTKGEEAKKDYIWMKMREESYMDVEREPILSSYYFASILAHNSLENALANHLANKLSNSTLPVHTLYDIFSGVLYEDQEILEAIKEDLKGVKERDPACTSYVHCFLNYKGFLACEAHRVAHNLWLRGREALALLIQNRVSEVLAVDIHPGAKIGCGILLDHGTGVVIGETVVIGNNVSILHNVTLGGTGKECGDRHPKIGDGVLIGAGTNVLGNVRIGEGAKIGAGAVVLKDVLPRTTAVGNPARLVGRNDLFRLDTVQALNHVI
ncbi:PREDICTED: serine [Prunus dulcis]|uniref:serine O-acetyltransferase n=1 Tax=Prunus dulcis TaxID=3755 RepID=A0A5E4G290_PRUDU|nr:serine acetyltransferase 1, chloroplastic-like [Prunus dulcis]VVA33935.1 PREDICTED: serine [Prunus dulcis]